MGHTAGWLTLGAGIAGGADVILIPEIPYDIDLVAESVLARSHIGKSVQYHRDGRGCQIIRTRYATLRKSRILNYDRRIASEKEKSEEES